MTFGDAIDVLLDGRIMAPDVARLIRPAHISPSGAIAGDAMARARMIASAHAGDMAQSVASEMLHLAELLAQVAADAIVEAAEIQDARLDADARRLAEACGVVQRHCRHRSRPVA